MKLYIKKKNWENKPIDLKKEHFNDALSDLLTKDEVTKIAIINDTYTCNVYSRLKNKWTISRTMKVDNKDSNDFINNCELETTKPLKEYMESVHLKNLEQTLLKESAPKVGLFWIDPEDKEIYSVDVKITDGEAFGAGTDNHYIVHPSSHYESWRKIDKPKKLKSVQYEDVPRGRVILKRNPVAEKNMFYVYMSPVLDEEEYKNMVLDEFKLPLSRTIFDFSDEHYFIDDEFINESNDVDNQRILDMAMAGDLIWYDIDLIIGIYGEVSKDKNVNIETEDFINFLDENYKEIGNDVFIDMDDYRKLK